MATTLRFSGTGGLMQGNAGGSDVECALDGVFSLDGTGDYFNIANQTNLQDIWTSGGAISLWIKPDSDSSDNDRIIDKDLWKFRLTSISAGKAALQFVREWSTGDNVWTTAAVLDIGYWHHLAVVYDDDAVGNDATIYINGIAIANASETNQGSGSASATSTAMAIGAKFDGSANFFHGSIADVRIYSSELTEAQIRKLASRMFIDNRLVRTDDTRLAHWHLNVKPSSSLLTAAINSSVTTIPVDRGLDFTDNDYQHILIEDEIMRITGISSNDLTVDNRSTASNRCGTTAATHDDNDVVYIIGMEDLSSNNYPVVLAGDLTTPSGDIDWHTFSVDVMECADNKIDIAKNMNGTEFASSTTATAFTAEASHSILVGMTLQIGSEKMYVSGVSTNTITVTRGIGGTTAANQANGSDIFIAPVNHIQGTLTTTSGTFNMGKTTAFNADSKYIQFTDSSVISGIPEMVVSAWFKCTGGSGDRVIIQKDTEYRIALNSSNYIEAYIYDSGGSARTTTHSVDMEDNKWHHVAIRWNGANNFLYVDGEFSTYTAGGTAAVNNNSTTLSIGLDYGASTFFVGKLKDIRIYNHDMDNFQIKALAQGSNLEVPSVWYPMDDDAQTTTATILNQGLGGAVTCSAENAGYVNSTYDTDGALTLGNGTVRLPRGTLKLTDITGTTGRIEHNDGILDVPNSSWGVDVTGLTAANERALHTINIFAGSTYLSLDACDIDVEGDITGTGGFALYNNSTLTMGTDTSISNFTAVARLWTTYSSSTLQGKSSLYPINFNPSSILWTNPYEGNKINFANVNSDADLTIPDAFNVTCTGDCEFDVITVNGADNGKISTFDTISTNSSGTAWTDGTYFVTDGTDGVTGADGTGAVVKIIISSGAAAVTIRTNGANHGSGYQVNSSWSVPDALLGNNGGPALTFDVATLCTGKFDMNGQRVKISGALNNSGVVDYDGLLDAYNINDDGTADNTASCDMMLSGIGSGDVTLDLQDVTYRNIMINAESNGKYENCPILNATNLIVAEGQIESTGTWALGDCTVATGGELDAQDDTHTISGDFTTSGGLIGKSALTLDGTSDYMRAGTYGSANNFTGWSNNNLTVEAWYKSSSSAQAGIIASYWGSGSKHFILYREANGSLRAAVNVDGGSTYVQTNTAEAGVSKVFQDADDGKWHNYAMTYDGANLKLYIDGALYANRAVAVTLVNGANGIFTIGAYHTGSNDTHSASAGLIGDVARCSVWNHTLTESEIRTMMFYDYATMDADSDFNTPQGDLKGWYQFDEGTSTSIDNLTTVTNVDGLLVNGAWSSAGTFTTTGDGKITMTGTGKSLNYLSGEVLGHLLIDNSSGTVTASVLHGTNNLTVTSLKVNDSSASFTAPAGTLTITGKNSGNYHIDIDGVFVHSSGTVKIDTSLTGDKLLDIIPSSGTGLNNLIINEDGSSNMQWNGNSTIAGNLTIEEGSFHGYDYNNSELTVGGDVTVEAGGTLGAAGQTGAYTFGSLTIADGGAFVASQGVTTLTKATGATPAGFNFDAPADGCSVTHNGGTIKFDLSSGDQKIRNDSGEGLNNLIVELDNGDFVHGSNLYLSGDLDITLATDHTMRANNAAFILSITGDVTIVEGKLGDITNYTGNHSFGSLTIQAGAEYIATSGTTTINSETTGGKVVDIASGGIFTHNKGKLRCEGSNGTDFDFDNEELYDLEIQYEDTNGCLNFDGAGSTPVTILNDFDIIMGKLRNNGSGSPWTVHGNAYIRETSKTNKNKWVSQASTQTIKGTLTVENGAIYDAANEGSGSSGTLNVGGIRVL